MPQTVPPGTSVPFSTLSTLDAVITVVRDPEHTLGKQFTLTADKRIDKRAAVSLSFGIARMHRVETHEELAALFREVGDDPHAAIINAAFNGIEIGEEFLILSERQIEKRLGVPRNDRERQAGVHTLEYEGKKYKAVGRFKENVRPSCWQYLDRDVDEHTPPEFANLSFGEWRKAVAKILPGFDSVTCCHVGSSSSRVLQGGQPVGGGNGHLWFRVADPSDVERFRTAAMVQAANAGLTWLKPRHSRIETGKVVGHSLTTVIDPSVFTPGRFTFVGRPVVQGDLTVEPPLVQIHQGEQDSFDTTKVELPDADTVRSITHQAGVELEVKAAGGSLSVSISDLTLDTELETEDLGILTVRELLERGLSDKVRCQTPFRASSSFAAFVGTGSDGTPFIHDVGTSISHWLRPEDRDECALAIAQGVCRRVLDATATDNGAPFEPEAIRALIKVRENRPADYQRFRADLKKRNRAVSVVELDKAVRQQRVKDDVPETHHGYARDLLRLLAAHDFPPVGHGGLLYCVDLRTNLWVGHPINELTKQVARHYDGLDHCRRAADYASVANLAIALATDPTFFVDAPVGLACPSGFYRIRDDQVLIEPLNPHHRQRVQLDFNPQETPTPLFDNFLHETFASPTQNDEHQQVTLLQEVVGAIMLGLLPRHHKAVVFYDPIGRAGKGTVERIIRRLVPDSFVTAISPFLWHREYYLASLAGARLNVVGELPDHEAIPAAAFKSVIGGDLLTGRHPNHRTVTFKNEAAHLFMSNHLINTRDHSEAFFARWIIIEFPNSRLRSGLPIDPSLAERIIEAEMPGVAQWALQGAVRLLHQGQFSASSVHDRLMAKWRRTANSLEEFIHESCILGEDHKVLRSAFYKAYRGWCADNGRRPFAKGKVRELLEHNLTLGVRLAKLDGYQLFRGIALVDDDAPVLEPLAKPKVPPESEF